MSGRREEAREMFPRSSDLRPGGYPPDPIWGYRGDSGPEHWADLDPAWAVARTGRRQSPIDVRTARVVPVAGPALQPDYRPTPLDVFNSGRVVGVQVRPASSLRVGAETWELTQFHFHTPAEHTVDGRREAMEAHLVHTNPTGELAVLAVLIREGGENPLLSRIWPHVPDRAGQREVPGVQVCAADLLPPGRASWRYSGSLTFPPCTECVSWLVLCESVEASSPQVEALARWVGPNARPVQPLHGRSVQRVD